MTQNRVAALLRDKLYYRYLGDWTDRLDNSKIKENLLTDCLTKCKYSGEQISHPAKQGMMQELLAGRLRCISLKESHA